MRHSIYLSLLVTQLLFVCVCAKAQEAVPYPEDLQIFQKNSSLLSQTELELAISKVGEETPPQEDACGWGTQIPGFCGGECSEIRYKDLWQLFRAEKNRICVLLKGTCKRPLLSCSCDGIGGEVLAEFPCSQSTSTTQKVSTATE